jgi:hypothetical protein
MTFKLYLKNNLYRIINTMNFYTRIKKFFGYKSTFKFKSNKIKICPSCKY